MRVLIVEPHKEPYEKEINKGIKHYEEIVGGLAEVVYIDENTLLLVNDIGKYLKLEGNRRLGNDIIAGTFIVCALDEEGEFASLSDEQVKRYYERFKVSEHYTQEEVTKAIYFEVRPF